MMRTSPRLILCYVLCSSLTVFLIIANALRPKRQTRASTILENRVQNSTLGFEKIFVINLPRRTDHRDAISLAAAVTDLQITWVAGVSGYDAHRLALPSTGATTVLKEGAIGNWRAHMDTLQWIVANKIRTALILEDDVDWDIRIKRQLADFAAAAHILGRNAPGTTHHDIRSEGWATQYKLRRLSPLESPYGDHWDVLWLGHCGTRFPGDNSTKQIPLDRVVLLNDETVPSSQHVFSEFGTDELITMYPNHTRAIHWSSEGVCTHAYAVTQHSSRQILSEIGLRPLAAPFDIQLRAYCDGTHGQRMHKCITSQPQYFEYHRPRGNKNTFSDINDNPDEMNERAYTWNIRQSVILNLQNQFHGEDPNDQWPDDTPGSTNLP